MSFLSFLRVDTGRLLRAKTTWLVILLTALCPLIGYSFYQPASATTTASVALANPVLAGGLCGAVLFAFLTLFELNRVYKAHTDSLMDAIVSPEIFVTVKLFSLLAVSLATVLLTAIAYLPYTVYRMDTAFSISDYILSFFLFMLCSIWLAILAASAFYHILRRVDLSFIFFVANGIVFRTSGYSRLFWFAIMIGFWIISLLCVRNHGKGLLGSFAHNVHKVYIPVLAILLVCGGVFLYRSEPFIDHSPLKTYNAVQSTSELSVTTSTSNMYAENNQNLTLLDTSVKAVIDTKHHNLTDTVTYQLQNSSGQPQDCTLQLKPGFTIHSITANGNRLNFTDKQNDHDNLKDVICKLPSDKNIELIVSYSGCPKIWSESRMLFLGSQIEKNYVNLAGTDLRPIINAESAKDAKSSGEITLPDNLQLVSMGETAKVLQENSNGTKTWQTHSISSIYAGDYVKVKIEGGGTPIYFYYSQKHQKQMEELKVRQMLENAIPYCTQHYGPLPYKEDKPLCIIQSSAYMQGGGAFGNISVIGESSLSNEGLVDPQKGSNGAEVMAHEIVHQWWGIRRMCMDMNNQSWTAEGVTVYTTYRLMKELYDDDYAQKNYLDVWNAELKNVKDNFYSHHPEYLNILPKKYVNRLQNQFAITNTYSGMASQIYKAAQLVGGEGKMDAILAELYKNGGTEMPPMVTWHDFLNACGLTEEDLNHE